jgi:hypothetical protein
VIEWLRRAHAQDIVGLETLEWRTERAYLVSSLLDLRALVADLPALRIRERLARLLAGLSAEEDATDPCFSTMFVSLPARADRPVLVGRSHTCTVRVADDTVSRRHLALEKQDAGWLVRDLGSTNGTFLEGVAIREALIMPGQFVEAGNTRLCVTFPGRG